MSRRRALALVVFMSLIVVGFAPAWWVKGHETITEAAAARLPDDMPAFFRNAGKHLAHYAGDPDRWKNRGATFLRPAEEGNHFLDLEDLEGKPLPGTNRFEGMALMRDLKKQPNKVGMLPYAIAEGYDRLSLAFYDHRKDPENEAIRWKCLVYAGTMAHYTTDASMPLHTTRDYDGRNQPDGSVKQKGIHAKLDGFPEKFKLTAEEMCRGLEAGKVENIWEHATKFLEMSHAHIPKCYELDAAGAFEVPTEESRAFVLGRCRSGAQLTLDVWYAAWLRSAKLPAHY